MPYPHLNLMSRSRDDAPMVPSSPCRKLTREAIPGGWTTERVRLDQHHFEILRPAEPDRFLEFRGGVEKLRSAEHCEDLPCPYWAALWPAAPKLARHLLRNAWPEGTAALELGCGIGLVGLAGLAAGLHVTFSDVMPIAVTLALENAKRNGHVGATGLVLDWFDPPSRTFPAVFGSDVLYDRELHRPLLNTLDAVLAGQGECWLGDPGRSACEPFLELAHQRGYSLRLSDEAGQPIERFVPGSFQLVCLRHGRGGLANP